MKKIFAFLLLAFSVAACSDDFEEDLIDPKSPTEVPAGALFTNAQRNLVDQLTTPNVNSGIFRLLAQQWANTTYPEESRYDLVTRNIPQNFWYTMYRDVLMDFRESKNIITEDATFTDAAQKANQLAIIEVMEVYSWSVLVNTFGDIPYTEALNPDNVYPKYDDDAAIYADLFTRLDAAIATLNAGKASSSFVGADLIYDGDVASWIKFANSLKLRLGMTIADADPAKAKAIVEAAVLSGVFTSADDNAAFAYTNATPNVNPVWTDLVESKRNDFVAANTLVDVMNTLNDPRRSAYFTEVGGVYKGGIYGNNNTYSTFSHVNPAITVPEFESLLLSYSEVKFYLAEAAARGFNVGSTATEHYNTAITASMNYWGITSEAQINAYLAQPSVAFNAANWRERIGVQKWISLYNRGFEAWTEFRRLDYPQLKSPIAYSPAYDIVPVRYPYPPSEKTLNQANVNAAGSAIGGDAATTKIFWDKF